MGSRSITYGIMSCSVTTSAKDSSGNFTISAYFTNTATTSATATNVRLSCSMTDSSPWSKISVGTVSAGSSASGSITMSSGNTSDDVVYCYLIFGTSATTGRGGSVSVDGYVDPTPYMSPISIAVSPTTQYMGEKVTVSESGGYYANVSQRQVIYNGSVIDSYSKGSWTPDIDTYEPLIPNSNSLTVSLRAYCTAASGAAGSGYSNTVSLALKVPADYMPTCTHDYEYVNPINNSLVANNSGLKITLYPEMTPYGNSATIASVVLKSVTSTTTSAIPTISFTQSGNTFTCTTLPNLDGAPSYSFKCVFRITDSRGNILDYETGAFRVTNFIPPYVSIDSLTRDTATTATIDISITSPSDAYLATIKVGDQTAVDVKDKLVAVTGGYTLSYSITGLASGNQYNVTFSYQDTNMYNYGEAAYSYTRLLSTLAMPLSLYDDGSRMAASFGEECADNYGEQCVINFAKDSYVRYIKDNKVMLLKVEDAFAQCPYNVGDIYITTLSSSPSDIWTGTTWEQLQNVFLYASGNYSVGATGGEETHTLTIDEMPSHNHRQQTPNWIQRGTDGSPKGVGDDRCGFQSDAYYTESTGGSGAHNNMPPYLVVNMWKRTG